MIREESVARRDRGLSLDDVGRAVGLSGSMVSRTESGRVSDVGVVRLSAMLSVVGLELWAKAYPGGSPLRDAGHVALLERFRARLHPSLRWAVEVPIPLPGDQRAWDAMITGRGFRYGTEAETHPTDAQALTRRLAAKERDGEVDGVLLVLPATHHIRGFLAAVGDMLEPSFPVAGRRALDLLGAGLDPGGSSIIVL